LNIWLQLFELGVYLTGGVFVAIAVGAFLWYKCLGNTTID